MQEHDAWERKEEYVEPSKRYSPLNLLNKLHHLRVGVSNLSNSLREHPEGVVCRDAENTSDESRSAEPSVFEISTSRSRFPLRFFASAPLSQPQGGALGVFLHVVGQKEADRGEEPEVARDAKRLVACMSILGSSMPNTRLRRIGVNLEPPTLFRK